MKKTVIGDIPCGVLLRAEDQTVTEFTENGGYF